MSATDKDRMGREVKRKIGSSMVIVPPLLFLILIGPPVVLLFLVLLATFLGLREYFALTLPPARRVEAVAGIVLGLLFSIIVGFGKASAVGPSLVFLLLSLSILFMATSQSLTSAVSDMAVVLFGILYLGFLLAHITLIRHLTDGRLWVFFLILTVWAGDISAFVAGSLLGKHKLYPKISPKKTWEGLAGAVLGSILVALAFRALFLNHVQMGVCALLATGLAVFGQIGDFSESLLKRSVQVKDSGSLIPGHGGMLDRLDSFLFAGPFLFYTLLALSKETP